MTILRYLFVAVLLATGSQSPLGWAASWWSLAGRPIMCWPVFAVTLSGLLIARRKWVGVRLYALFA